MTRQVTVWLLALVTASCTVVQGEEVASGEVTTTTLTPSTTAADTTTTTVTGSADQGPTTTSSIPPAVPLALVSPSGVTVAITGRNGLVWRVRTPCGNEAFLARGTPVGRVDVVLDPGHGGPIDTGAVAASGLQEKNINLEVASAVGERLSERGVSVILTRTADYASPLSVRAQLADAVEAEIMVSIHHNAPIQPQSTTPGVEVFIQSGSADSKRLGGLLWEHTMDRLSVFGVEWVAAPDAGVMTVLNTRGTDAYGILRRPETTTALIELGYIANPAEAELFDTSAYLRVVSEALTEAIEDYLNTDKIGSGFVPSRVFNPQPGVGKDVCVDPDLG